MISKLLVNINNMEEIDEYKKASISNFLFAVKGYSIGYNSFDLDVIPDNSYLLINRIFDSKSINEFKSIIPKLNRFKGVLFEDVGIFYLLKNTNLELIWNQSHFVVNYDSINYYLNNGCTSCVISSDITSNEIKEILNNSIKPLVLPILGKNMIMYSRRYLLTNFNCHATLNNYNDVNLVENITNNNFFAREDSNGTVIFNNGYFNYVDFAKSLDDSKIKYYLVYNLDLSPREVLDILNGKKFGNDGFLNKKTVYKMSEYTDRS